MNNQVQNAPKLEVVPASTEPKKKISIEVRKLDRIEVPFMILRGDS